MRDYSTGVLNDSSTFAVVIAGEYNAGKSTLINALVGEKLLETGSLPTTDCITILSYDNDDNDGSSSHSDVSSSDVQQQQPQPQPPMENSSSRNSSGVVHYRVALPLLQDLTVVDTPGTNAVVKDHTVLTLRLLPSADLILFVTSADRPFPESERALLESIAVHYRKSIVVVINKMDVLDDSGGIHGMVEKQKVIDFVTEHASALLGARPIVLAISARDALAAKLTGQAAKESAVWKRSNFAALERFLRDTLTTETKIKSKLSSPIGVAEGLLDECRQKLQQDKRELETDISTLNLLHSQFAAWRKETTADMDAAANEIQIVLEQQGARGSLLLRRMSLLDFYYTTVDDMPLRHEWFQTRPLARTYMYSSFPSQHPPQQHRQPHTNNTVQSELLERVQETADSIAIRGRAQGQAVIEFLGKRPAVRNQSLVGSVTAASRFEDVRKHLVETLSQAVIRNLNDVDDTVEEDLLLKRLQQTAWLSAALNAGSLGLVAAVATQQLDVLPGVTSFAALAISSAFCVQVGRTRLVQQYADRWARRSQRLDEDITTIGAKEADRVDRKIRDGVAPYTRFVQAEQERIDQQLDLCEELTASAQRLRKRINNLRL